MVIIEELDPASVDATSLLNDYVRHVTEVTGLGRDRPEPALALHPERFRAPGGAFLVARTPDRRAVGCGGVEKLDPSTAEVQRLWVDPAARGLGIGAALLAALEETAAWLGATRLVLGTRDELVEALRLYVRAGWTPVPVQGDSPATQAFEKHVDGRR